ncbi:hypothetical protein GCM10027569_37340 [Flindersiella endophytica]
MAAHARLQMLYDKDQQCETHCVEGTLNPKQGEDNQGHCGDTEHPDICSNSTTRHPGHASLPCPGR